MRHQRLAAAESRGAAQVRAATAHTQAVTAERIPPAEQAQERDVAPWLRKLGLSAGEVRRGVALCEAIPEASLEERVRLALSSLARGGRRRAMPGVGSPV